MKIGSWENTACSLVLAASLIFSVFCVSAYSQLRPKRGSIVFGTEEPPVKQKSVEIESFRNVFSLVASKVVPCVVSVIPTKVDTVLFFKNPFRRFFDDEDTSFEIPYQFFYKQKSDENRKGKDNGPSVEKRERHRQGLGSGVIVSKDGYILTNYHVIDGAAEIEVDLVDNRTFQAVVIGADSLCDVAVIRIKGSVPKDLPVAYLGNSDSIQTGEWVAAIGNPFSLTSTITSGIISALKRQVEDLSMFQNFIQTDAAINPGNSGGALVNVYGELIGINSLIYSRTGGYMGIGFAIPVNMARAAMEDLIYEGKVIRGWIGVGIQEIGPTARKVLGLDFPGGVLITDVFKGQPAESAGIKTGDIITEIDKRKIDTPNDLRNIIASMRPGSRVQLTVLRNGKKSEVSLTITERTSRTMIRSGSKAQKKKVVPEPEQKSRLFQRIGIEVDDLSENNRIKYEIVEPVKGVVITALGRFTDDPRQELVPGDLILQVKSEGKEFRDIHSKDDFHGAFKNVHAGKSVILLAQHEGSSFFVAFTAGQ